jgi:uncharacterized protein (TIGR02246 family)
MSDEHEIVDLHRRLLACWNERDAEGYARLFHASGTMVGFDGTTMQGPDVIAEHLGSIFADHTPATYVAVVREVRELGDGAALLRADAVMVPPGADDLEPDLHTVQALVAVGADGARSIAHFQNTPAAFHGRPDDRQVLTDELRAARRVADAAT